MIEIKLRTDDKWRLVLKDEEWEFDDEDAMIKTLKELMSIKKIYGKLKYERNDGR